jgi:hypothetical protein
VAIARFGNDAVAHNSPNRAGLNAANPASNR